MRRIEMDIKEILVRLLGRAEGTFPEVNETHLDVVLNN
jgi:hypothetical protein